MCIFYSIQGDCCQSFTDALGQGFLKVRKGWLKLSQEYLPFRWWDADGVADQMWNVDGGLGDPRAAGWFIQVMHSGRGIMIGEMEAGGFNQV